MFEIGIGLLILLALAKKGGGGGIVPPVEPDPTVKPPKVLVGVNTGGGVGPGAPKLPKPALPEMFGNTLTVSDDCKTVTVGNTWWEKTAMPAIISLVDSGHGLPIYTAEDAARSVDALVRTVVHDDAAACIDNAPWLDRYIKTHPIPQPELLDMPGEHLARMVAWDNAWDAEMSAWAGTHAQAFDLFRQIGQTAVKLWLNNMGVTGTQGEDGEASPGLNAGEEQALRNLGYNLDPLVVELFQADWNNVNLYRFGVSWFESEADIAIDNKIGPDTRGALKAATTMQTVNGPWRGLVAAAEGG